MIKQLHAKAFQTVADFVYEDYIYRRFLNFVTPHLSHGIVKASKSVFELLEALMNKKLIRVGKYTLLIRILNELELRWPAMKLQEFQRKIKTRYL